MPLLQGRQWPQTAQVKAPQLIRGSRVSLRTSPLAHGSAASVTLLLPVSTKLIPISGPLAAFPPAGNAHPPSRTWLPASPQPSQLQPNIPLARIFPGHPPPPAAPILNHRLGVLTFFSAILCPGIILFCFLGFRAYYGSPSY